MGAVFMSPRTGGVFQTSAPVTYEVVRDSIELLDPTALGQARDVSTSTSNVKFGSEVTFDCDIQYQLVSEPLGGFISLEAVDISPGSREPIITRISENAQRTTYPKTKTLRLQFRAHPKSDQNTF